jgi:hypothetical protein
MDIGGAFLIEKRPRIPVRGMEPVAGSLPGRNPGPPVRGMITYTFFYPQEKHRSISRIYRRGPGNDENSMLSPIQIRWNTETQGFCQR